MHEKIDENKTCTMYTYWYTHTQIHKLTKYIIEILNSPQVWQWSFYRSHFLLLNFVNIFCCCILYPLFKMFLLVFFLFFLFLLPWIWFVRSFVCLFFCLLLLLFLFFIQQILVSFFSFTLDLCWCDFELFFSFSIYSTLFEWTRNTNTYHHLLSILHFATFSEYIYTFILFYFIFFSKLLLFSTLHYMDVCEKKLLSLLLYAIYFFLFFFLTLFLHFTSLHSPPHTFCFTAYKEYSWISLITLFIVFTSSFVATFVSGFCCPAL